MQLTFAKDNLQHYNLKLTKTKPHTKTLERNQLSTTEFRSVFKRDEKTDHFVLNSFSQLVVQEINFSSLILSRAREKIH